MAANALQSLLESRQPRRGIDDIPQSIESEATQAARQKVVGSHPANAHLVD
jgi:hypothetical protein